MIFLNKESKANIKKKNFFFGGGGGEGGKGEGGLD